MRLEYRRGHVQAALAQFEDCRRLLRAELATEPLPETLDLARLISRGAAETSEWVGARGGPRPPARRMPPQLLRPPELIGRETAWARMESAWRDGRALFLTGEGGVGKSRLMLDFAASRGRYLLNEGRPGDANVPFSSMTRGLRRIRAAFPDITCDPWAERSLANIAPDVFTGVTPRPLDDDIKMGQLVEAFVRMIEQLAARVDALPADDAHYFDAVSALVGEAFNAEWLTKEHAPRLITAFRPADMPAATLELVRAGAAQGLSTVIALEPLDEEQTRALLASLEMPRNARFSRQLHRYTGGNPTFIVETLKDLYRRDALEPDARHFDMSSGDLSARVAALLTSRLDALRPDALRLLRALAVTQPDTSAELLAVVLGRDPLDVADALGALSAQGIVQGVRFVHDLLLEAVTAHTPAATLRLLHQRAAQALSGAGGDSVRIAHHWQRTDQPLRAAPYWLAAAESYWAAGLRQSARELLAKAAPFVGDGAALEPALGTLPPHLRDELELLLAADQRARPDD